VLPSTFLTVIFPILCYVIYGVEEYINILLVHISAYVGLLLAHPSISETKRGVMAIDYEGIGWKN
jgi:hypothetical protein